MDTNAPKYISVFNEIKTDILSGKYLPNTFLPTEDKLIELYNTSRTTIRKAVGLLREEQMVDVRQGRGTQVIFQGTFAVPFGLQKSHNFMHVNVTNQFLCPTPHTTASQGAVIDIVTPNTTVEKSLGLQPGSSVYRFQRVKLVNDTIFAYVVSYIPVEYCPEIETLNGKITNLYKTLQEKYGIKIETGQERITAISAGFLESKILDIPVGTAMLSLNRVTVSNGKPLEVSNTLFNPSLYELVIDMSGISHDFD